MKDIVCRETTSCRNHENKIDVLSRVSCRTKEARTSAWLEGHKRLLARERQTLVHAWRALPPSMHALHATAYDMACAFLAALRSLTKRGDFPHDLLRMESQRSADENGWDS